MSRPHDGASMIRAILTLGRGIPYSPSLARETSLEAAIIHEYLSGRAGRFNRPIEVSRPEMMQDLAFTSREVTKGINTLCNVGLLTVDGDTYTLIGGAA